MRGIFSSTEIMRKRTSTLHGNAPESARAALLLIDMINDLEFPGGDQLLSFALPMACKIVLLKQQARAAQVPVIYVNDNFGRWQSNFQTQVEHCLKENVRGRPIAELLKPLEDDYFVLKPKHSGFFCTALELLLNHLGVETVVLTGIAGNNCVLFTANDAYLRDLKVIVPHDCIASETAADNDAALRQMEKALKADTRAATELDLRRLNAPPKGTR